jgi:16S rRNA (uracil1498-N3)-methyltransferase
VKRRIHLPSIEAGRVELSAEQSHYLRDVLRLEAGAEVEVFDDAGAVARGVLQPFDGRRVMVEVDRPRRDEQPPWRWTIASAVPKANRADWMIEKLSELGASAYVPLAAGRSVVVPEGQNKMQRWQRLATEAAKQSRRRGVMSIEPLSTPAQVLHDYSDRQMWVLSTEPEALPIPRAMERVDWDRELLLLVGPEGGWTAEEIALFNEHGLTGVKLTETILRMETAAVAAAAVVACWGASGRRTSR